VASIKVPPAKQRFVIDPQGEKCFWPGSYTEFGTSADDTEVCVLVKWQGYPSCYNSWELTTRLSRELGKDHEQLMTNMLLTHMARRSGNNIRASSSAKAIRRSAAGSSLNGTALPPRRLK
jgi:hypothetical protein